MSTPDSATITHILQNGPHRSEVGRKQLTLALGGHYIASTTLSAKPVLVWESEKSYARYYIPVKSLHPDIKEHVIGSETDLESRVNGGASLNVPVNIEVIDTIEGKNNEARALIERVTIDQKTITWTRFAEGVLKGLIRFERSEIDDWFENGAIFASIKNPYKRIDTSIISRHIVVNIDGEEVAKSDVAVLLNETGLKETYYLPAVSIKNWGSIEKSTLKTACPYKGEASYLSITVQGKKHENLIWYYPYPTHESAAVEGLISFYNKENVEILVDGVRI